MRPTAARLSVRLERGDGCVRPCRLRTEHVHPDRNGIRERGGGRGCARHDHRCRDRRSGARPGRGVTLSDLDAGADATIHALGSASANATLGGSLWAAADGSLSSDYLVEDDIVALWARGDISGTYLNRDNVQSVISHGGISASITAGGLANPNDADGDGYGHIVLVRAWNNVAGILIADTSIDESIAGGVVSATLNGPLIGTVSEHNRTGFQHWDQPRPSQFDWLNSLTAELQHFNGLLEGVIADVASAAQSALVAAAP